MNRIGLFDSGVGGLSVLAAVRAALPDAALHYVADSAWAPYGDLDTPAIRARALGIAQHLVQAGAQLVVVACNTATAAAVDELRAQLAPRPIIGIEPGLRPALAATRNGRVGVLATRSTLASRRFQALLAREAAGRPVQLQAAVGLADAIESGALDGPALTDLVERHCRPLREAGVDTVALGCTHYPFVRDAIQLALGARVTVIDTSAAVAAQVARVAATLPPVTPPAPPDVLLQTTGAVAPLQAFAAQWLPFPVRVEAAPADLR
ncbi:MAG: glutamate racemase [Piscinibacter sp.]|nr:glutamate racemase [Piscinibacter sp.]